MIWKKKEHTLGYYIFSISHGLYYMNDEKLKMFGMTNQQGRLLEVIYDNIQAGKEISRKFCEDIMHLSGPSITNILNGLEEKGCIARIPRKEDHRSMSITVTEKGEELIYKIRNVFFEAEQQLQKKMTQDEIEGLKKLLKVVYHNLPDETK